MPPSLSGKRLTTVHFNQFKALWFQIKRRWVFLTVSSGHLLILLLLSIDPSTPLRSMLRLSNEKAFGHCAVDSSLLFLCYSYQSPATRRDSLPNIYVR